MGLRQLQRVGQAGASGGRHFLSLSLYLGISEFFFHSQMCRFQSNPVHEVQIQLDLRNCKAQ